MRDMVGAVLLLVLIIGGLLAITGSCSFSPGGPTIDPSSAPSVDAAEQLDRAASSVTFPVRRPDVPGSWRSNSASTVPVGATDVVVRIGWVTPTGTYVQLNQSGGDRADVVRAETGQEEPKGEGKVDVAGESWSRYPAHGDEQAWVTELDGTVVLITGSASEQDFRDLATAVQEVEPLTP
jgi:hypothetical protein